MTFLQPVFSPGDTSSICLPHHRHPLNFHTLPDHNQANLAREEPICEEQQPHAQFRLIQAQQEPLVYTSIHPTDHIHLSVIEEVAGRHQPSSKDRGRQSGVGLSSSLLERGVVSRLGEPAMHHFNQFSQSLAGRLSALPSQAAAAAASGSGQQPQQRMRLRPRHVAVSAAAAAAAGLGGMHLSRQVRLSQQHAITLQQRGQPPFLIPRELAEVICGAFGEIVQVALLYPLDTIKVRCQAGGLSVRAVLQQLAASGSPARVLGQLYAGVAGASLASVAVGSLYYFTFCAAKRAATKLVADQQQQQPSMFAAGSSGAAAGEQHHHFPHGSTVDCHCHDSVFAAICSDDAAAAKAARGSNPSSSSSQPAAAASEPGSPSCSSSSSSLELSSHGKLQANLLAACAAALVGALIEAPVELFKHRAQAGQISGSMLGSVVQAVRQGGVLALYGSFFLPFCFKSLPFDVAELLTYSSLQDAKAAALASQGGAGADAAAAPRAVQAAPAAAPAPAFASLTAAAASGGSGSGLESMLSGVPDHAWDMAIGAAAGAAAVMCSQPPDVIKTVMETGGGVVAAPGSGVLGSAGAFVGTGRQLLKQHGAGGLWMGLAPRLVESVPSTMFYWLAVEGCRRLLEPYTAK